MTIRENAARVIGDLAPRLPTLGPPLPVVIPVEWPQALQKRLADSPLYPFSRTILAGELKVRDLIEGKKG